MSIQAIDQASIHSLTSGQVVTDLTTAVKELLENALDAGATSVEINFRDYGVLSVEVKDNGNGIDETDWSSIALKHHTSKLTTFSDLTSVSTLGFRGEALSSLCGTASLSIFTSTAATAPMGTALSFAQNGECIVGIRSARSKGTTSTVKDLFKSLPVRRKDLEKNKTREFGKACAMIQAYAMIRTGCRIVVSNTIGTGKQSPQLQTTAATNVRANFSSIFGAKALPSMMDLYFALDVPADKSVLKWSEEGVAPSTRVLVKGLISKPTPGNGRSSGDRQYFYVNGRPFAPTKVAKAMTEVYRNFVTGSFPSIVADFQLAADAYDVNVSPDKRTIFLHSEGNLLVALKAALETFFQPYRSTYPMIQIAPPPTAKTSTSKQLKPRSSEVDVAEASRDGSDIEGERSLKRGRNVNASDLVPVKREDVEDDDAPEAMDQTMVVDDEEAEQTLSRKRSKVDDATPVLSRSTSSATRSTPVSLQSTPIPRNTSKSRTDTIPDAEEEEEQEIDQLPSSPVHLARQVVHHQRSPSSAAPLQIMRQTTLNTTGASWAVQIQQSAVTPITRKSDSVSRLQRAVAASSSSKTMLLASEVVDEVEVVGDEDATREVDDQFEAEAEDEEIVIEATTTSEKEQRRRSASASSDIIIGDTSIDVERLEHLASLDVDLTTSSTSQRESEFVGEREIRDLVVDFDMESVVADWTRPLSSPVASTSRLKIEETVGASVEQTVDEAEATLSRVVSKEDFEKMEIIGQFNLGFIIVRRRMMSDLKGKGKMVEGIESMQDDLFIVDQHASDEKYNFERLQETTVIQSQQLLAPRVISLPSQDEHAAIDHLEVLRMNGFELLIDETADVGQRVKLKALPVSKGTEFSVADLEELLDLVKSSPVGTMIRPSKTRKMFASRACRMSVMIGKALNVNQMTTILRHMGTMNQPWACPHGRPTMRWMSSLERKDSTEDTRNDCSAILAMYRA